MGEVPPYFVSYMAAKRGVEHDMDEIDALRAKTDVVSRMQVWMLDFMEWGGFWGIVAMAAWPNAAFDMCGIVCGHLLFPLWKFLGATIIGKGLMKAPMQAVFRGPFPQVLLTRYSDLSFSWRSRRLERGRAGSQTRLQR